MKPSKPTTNNNTTKDQPLLMRGEVRGVHRDSLDDLVERYKKIVASGQANTQADKFTADGGGANVYDVHGTRGPVVMTGCVTPAGLINPKR